MTRQIDRNYQREEKEAVTKEQVVMFCTKCHHIVEHKLFVMPCPAFKYINRFICSNCDLMTDA